MFKYNNKLAVVASTLLLLGLFSCGDSKYTPSFGEQNEAEQTTLRISNNQESNTHTTSSNTESFFVKLNTPYLWKIKLVPEEAQSWITLSKNTGSSALDEGITVTIGGNKSEQREAKLVLEINGKESTQEIRIVQQGIVSKPIPDNGSAKPDNGAGTNEGSNNPSESGKPGENNIHIPAGEHIHGMVNLIEVPRLMGGSNMYFITHKTQDGKVNYSLEYDVNKRHARWVAYTWDKETSKDITSRNDAWTWDPIIPSKYSTDNLFSRTGFSRGHLVASNDRQHSVEANKQTFYYSNMSPQRQDHNGGIWAELEKLLQNWARTNSLKYDVIYVAKGGTIADHQIEEKRMRGVVVVPKYYWMAVVVKNGEQYKGIGFWTEHLKPQRLKNNLKTVARSIDEIEALTQIDLFPNLDDRIETEVEKQAVEANIWPGL